MRLKVLTLAAVAAATALGGVSRAAEVAIEVAGVKTANGPLYVSLQTREQFMQPMGSAGTVVASPASGTLNVVLPNVAPGDYSVSIWHDIDGDGEFDRGPDGRPIDGWSMLNAASLRGAPEFDAVKFTVAPAGASLRLDMIYAP